MNGAVAAWTNNRAAWSWLLWSGKVGYEVVDNKWVSYKIEYEETVKSKVGFCNVSFEILLKSLDYQNFVSKIVLIRSSEKAYRISMVVIR